MDFKKLFDIYGDELPHMLEFLYDGKHDVTLKKIAKFYGARRGYLVWGKFLKDYGLFVLKQKAEQAAAKHAGKVTDKAEDILDKVEDVVEVVEDVVDVVDGVLDLFGKGDDDDSNAK